MRSACVPDLCLRVPGDDGVLGDGELCLLRCERLGSVDAQTLNAVAWLAATLRGPPLEPHALCALEAALALVQAQPANTPAVWLLTLGAQLARGAPGAAHAGAWGLARSAREEAQLRPR